MLKLEVLQDFSYYKMLHNRFKRMFTKYKIKQKKRSVDICLAADLVLFNRT